jgi:predicted lipid-binding transport protein (Tim44 family)
MTRARIHKRPRLATLVLLSLTACSCTKLARCEMDKVRADVLDYETQTKPLQKEERQLRQRIDEFEGKVFTNQKAGVDLLKAVLVRATLDYTRKLVAVRVRSHLIRPHHQRKVHAYQQLALAYEQLMRAYPQADFAAIRAGLKIREQAMRKLEAVQLKLARLIRKYKRRRR